MGVDAARPEGGIPPVIPTVAEPPLLGNLRRLQQRPTDQGCIEAAEAGKASASDVHNCVGVHVQAVGALAAFESGLAAEVAASLAPSAATGLPRVARGTQ